MPLSMSFAKLEDVELEAVFAIEAVVGRMRYHLCAFENL